MPALSIARANSLSMTLYLYNGIPKKDSNKNKNDKGKVKQFIPCIRSSKI